MSTIELKSANLRSSVPRSSIRRAVEDAFRHFGLYQKANLPVRHAASKKAAKKK